MLVSRPLTIAKILGGEARGRKKVRMATKWDNRTPLSWAADNGHEAVVKLLQSTAGDEVICDLRRSQIVR
jgi:hypothetical protein